MGPILDSEIVTGNGKVTMGSKELSPIDATLKNGVPPLPINNLTHITDSNFGFDFEKKPRNDSLETQISFSSNSSIGGEKERFVSESESEMTVQSEDGQGREATPAALALPTPPDGGWGWLVVLGTILAGALIPSLFICFGVLMNTLLDVYPNESKSTASWIPSIMNSLMNCMGPITSGMIAIYSVKSVTFVGGIILSSGLVLSFFTNSISALYFTYGILGGIGAGMSLAPGFYLISQYFRKRRGLATGICMSGSSLGQMILPHAIQFFLEEYGYRGCILILGGLTLNICVSASLFRTLEAPKPKPKAIASTLKSKRIRSITENSIHSSFTFIPDEGIYVSGKTSDANKNGDRPKQSKTRHRKSKKSGGKRNGDPKNAAGAKKVKRCSTKNSIEKDVHLAAMERTWQNAQKAEADVPSPPRSRSRTLSLDSCRILPGIPEEHEEEKFESCEEGEPEVNEPEAEQQEVDVNIEEKLPMLATPEVISGENNNKNGTNGETADNRLTIYYECQVDLGLPETVPEPEPEEVSAAQMRRNAYFRRQSSNISESGVSLHHHFCGSVASVESLEGANVAPPNDGKRTLKQIMVHFYRSMAFGIFFRLGIFHILTGSFTLMIVTLANFSMFVPPYGLSIGLTRDESAGLITFIAMASMCGRLLMPALTDWLHNSKKHLFSACCLTTAVAILVTVFSTSYTMLLVSLLMFGFASGGSIAISINVFLDYIPLPLFNAFYGLTQFVLGIVILFVSPIMGLLVDKTGSFVPTFITLSIGSVLSACLLYMDRFVKPINPATTITF